MSTSNATSTTPTATDHSASPGHHERRWYASNAGQGTPGPTPPPGRQEDSMSKLLIGKYPATIYPEYNGYVGAVSLGFDGKGNRRRIKRRGRTKAAVKDKLIKAVEELEAGLKPAESYTIKEAVNDWLAKGLKGRDEHTLTANRI